MKRLSYDPEVDALYVKLTESPVDDTDEIEPGIILNLDAAGRVVGVEILDVKARLDEAQSDQDVEIAA